MTRNLVLTAAVLAGGLLVAGCGPVAEATKKGADAAKEGTDKAKDAAKEGMDKAKEGVDKAKEAVGDLASKAKEAMEGFTKDNELIAKAIAALSKAKTDEKDAEKAKTLGKLEGEANTLFEGLKKQLSGLGSLKDLASLDGAKAAIAKIITELKEKLKDYLPKG